MKVHMLVAVVAALTFSAASLAGPKTTGPGQHVTISVTITDREIVVYDQAQMARGAIVTFLAFNDGKKVHDFSLLGKTTQAIKPRHWGRITITLLTRGRFPFLSTFDKGKGFRGFFTVY